MGAFPNACRLLTAVAVSCAPQLQASSAVASSASVPLGDAIGDDDASPPVALTASGFVGGDDTADGGNADDVRVLRFSRKVDVFSYGCIVHYVLTNGTHPFGDSAHDRQART